MMKSAVPFKVGDQVQSPAGFFGRVTRVDNGTVYCTYAEKGVATSAIYTPDWFRLYGRLLRRLEQGVNK